MMKAKLLGQIFKILTRRIIHIRPYDVLIDLTQLADVSGDAILSKRFRISIQTDGIDHF
jgi:hypothetical protein